MVRRTGCLPFVAAGRGRGSGRAPSARVQDRGGRAQNRLVRPDQDRFGQAQGTRRAQVPGPVGRQAQAASAVQAVRVRQVLRVPEDSQVLPVAVPARAAHAAGQRPDDADATGHQRVRVHVCIRGRRHVAQRQRPGQRTQAQHQPGLAGRAVSGIVPVRRPRAVGALRREDRLSRRRFQDARFRHNMDQLVSTFLYGGLM